MDFITGETFFIDKPLTWTSFNVVKRLRSEVLRRLRLHKLKVGHAGTLDPLATGVMIIVTGRSTRLIEQLQTGIKKYRATLRLGATTPSFDLETPVDGTYPTAHITPELIERTLPQFTGTILQTPPAFSACKVDGRRAYSMARKGKTVELKPKTLVIDALDIVDFNPEEMTLTIDVTCGKGTYIRALARDIGEALGTGAHLTALRRTRVGDATIDKCLTIEQAVELIKTAPVSFPEDFLRQHPEYITE